MYVYRFSEPSQAKSQVNLYPYQNIHKQKRSKAAARAQSFPCLCLISLHHGLFSRSPMFMFDVAGAEAKNIYDVSKMSWKKISARTPPLQSSLGDPLRGIQSSSLHSLHRSASRLILVLLRAFARIPSITLSSSSTEGTPFRTGGASAAASVDGPCVDSPSSIRASSAAARTF